MPKPFKPKVSPKWRALSGQRPFYASTRINQEESDLMRSASKLQGYENHAEWIRDTLMKQAKIITGK